MTKDDNCKGETEKLFKLVSPFEPAGDQPQAIEQLTRGLNKGVKDQILLGVTGSGKTFTMAQVINKIQKPTLILAHNKTLAAQLCSEFQEFFPENAVSYFVSYYDYYQPEAYLPVSDTYIAKDASINDEINKYRHTATMNLLTRKDVIIIASVSCIYGLGSVQDYKALAITLKVGEMMKRDTLLRRLTDIQYTRSGNDFKPGMFHVLGDVVEIFPPSSDDYVYRLEFFGDEIENIVEADSFTGEVRAELSETTIFPAKHSVTTEEKVKGAIEGIQAELFERHAQLLEIGKALEAERLKTRTEYDIDMLRETGYVTGIENYVRYFDYNGEEGRRPTTLMDYFSDDFLLFIDESHITVPQIGGMHGGNYSRKKTLVEHGFRMPSSFDNRPLNFPEFEKFMNRAVYVSATPSKYEYAHTLQENIAEQIVRPTGLIDPEVKVKSSNGQIDDIKKEISETISRGERVLITTLTKKSAERLTEYLVEGGIKVRYLHSDIDTMERIEILRDLRLGKFDVLVGINLLREGLDLPEVSFIAILDADKQGFLRSTSALIQTIGRCARNVSGHVTMYSSEVEEDGKTHLKITPAMREALDETDRRRMIQVAHNTKHNITPETIKKAVRDITIGGATKLRTKKRDKQKIPKEEIARYITSLEAEMDIASLNMQFEKAADLRDEIDTLKQENGMLGVL
ncbi:excinuclease ABC subunit UvrB [Candidatus Peregrinibacteria bacterium]|nr:excinuclease ABC subunit UvrB [Candidatus Peregrinibacteria bacterium]